MKTFFILSFSFYCSLAFSQDLSTIDKKKPVKIYGSFGLGCWYYTRSGPQLEKRSPFSWYLNGSPTLQLYNFTFPFTLTVSEQQRDFTQPFNQYGVSPYYKKLTLHLGYRNMNFSQYTMAGQTFLGAGVEFNPGKLRLAGMYGRFRKALPLDTINQSYMPPNYFPSYKRMGAAAKIGVGSKSNFVDLIFFKGWDDEKSISISDTLTVIRPGENICSGIKSNFTLAKRLFFDIDLGASMVTLDKRREDDVRDILNEAPNFTRNLMKTNYTTHLYLAGHGSVTYKIKKFSLRGMYKYVQADYSNFGSNFIQGDLQDITLTPSFSLLKGKVNFSGTIGQRTDNLQGNKAATSVRTLLNTSITCNVSQKIAFGINYGNFGVSQQSGAIQLNDSIRISTVNQTAGGNFRYTTIKEKKTNMFMVFGNYSNVNDRNELTTKFTSSNTFIGNFTFSSNITKLKMGYQVGVSYAQVENVFAQIRSYGPSLGWNKILFKEKIKTAFTSSFQARMNGNKMDGSVFNLNADISYSIDKKNTFTVGAFVMNNTSQNTSAYSYNEQRIILRYMYNF